MPLYKALLISWAGSDMEPINIDELSDILGTSDPGIIRAVLDVWLSSCTDLTNAVSNAMAAQDRVSLRKAVHGLKGTSLQIGAKQLAMLCKRLEDELPDSDWTMISDLVDRIFVEVKHAQSFAKNFLSGA